MMIMNDLEVFILNSKDVCMFVFETSVSNVI